MIGKAAPAVGKLINLSCHLFILLLFYIQSLILTCRCQRFYLAPFFNPEPLPQSRLMLDTRLSHVQVTDMMVANSSNLIVTVKPADQRYPLHAERGTGARASQLSRASGHSLSQRSSSDGDDSSLLAARADGVLHL